MCWQSWCSQAGGGAHGELGLTHETRAPLGLVRRTPGPGTARRTRGAAEVSRLSATEKGCVKKARPRLRAHGNRGRQASTTTGWRGRARCRRRTRGTGTPGNPSSLPSRSRAGSLGEELTTQVQERRQPSASTRPYHRPWDICQAGSSSSDPSHCLTCSCVALVQRAVRAARLEGDPLIVHGSLLRKSRDSGHSWSCRETRWPGWLRLRLAQRLLAL